MGDQFGGEVRSADAAAPSLAQGIMASNHFLKYRVDPKLGPATCNGGAASFSSLWRYEAGSNKLQALDRTGKLTAGVEDVHWMLQGVSHGTTEHSIIIKLRANRSSQLWFSVASPNGAWDANFEKLLGP